MKSRFFFFRFLYSPNSAWTGDLNVSSRWRAPTLRFEVLGSQVKLQNRTGKLSKTIEKETKTKQKL